MPSASISRLAALLGALLLCACTTERSSVPARTATEQLLISTAADRAARQLVLNMPKGTKVFLDTRHFDGLDDGYAIQAIRRQMLKTGLFLVDDREKADAIVMVASGALSTDQKSLLIGIPQLQVPFFPVGNLVSVPEIALFKSSQDKGVAKFVVTGYDARTGQLIDAADARYGFSNQTNHKALLFFSWESSDLIPPDVDQKQLSVRTLTEQFPLGFGAKE